MRGGSRVNSGPPPDPNALRRDRPSDKDGWRMLPADGRKGRTPTWPLLPELNRRAAHQVAKAAVAVIELDLEDAPANRRPSLEKKLTALGERVAVLEFQLQEQERMERSLWKDLWRTPQATVWGELGWHRDVAQYVRHKVLGELGSLDDAKEARQWSDRLGLNPAAMMRNRWRVADAMPSTRRTTTAGPPARPRSSSRSRLRAVPDDAGA